MTRINYFRWVSVVYLLTGKLSYDKYIIFDGKSTNKKKLVSYRSDLISV